MITAGHTAVPWADPSPMDLFVIWTEREEGYGLVSKGQMSMRMGFNCEFKI
jgi:hypothetical protein